MRCCCSHMPEILHGGSPAIFAIKHLQCWYEVKLNQEKKFGALHFFVRQEIQVPKTYLEEK